MATELLAFSNLSIIWHELELDLINLATMTLIEETDEDYIPEKGALFNFGNIGSEEMEPKLWIKNDKIIDLSCGDEFVIIITESGRVFSYGKNDWGQLGLGNTKSTLYPSCIKSLKNEDQKAMHVACGRYHSLISTESNKLFGFGSNNDGQLGMDQSISFICTPSCIKSWIYGGIKQLAAGGAFSAAINDVGSLYVWGSNSESQLGLGKVSDDIICIPTQIQFFSTPISFVDCGNYHTAAITENKLYIWGEAADQKLGDNLKHNQDTPQQILSHLHIVQVSCGHSHSICLSDSGDIYVWGKGNSGQLGLGSKEINVGKPTLLKIPFLLNQSRKIISESYEKFISIAAGENHTVIINQQGLAFSFGEGRHGKLGNIGEVNNYSDIQTPRLIEKLSKSAWVENVKCGGCHTVILVRNRQLEELINDLNNDTNHSFDIQSSLTVTNSSDCNSLSMRARRQRRNNIKNSERSLPKLTQSLPITNSHFLPEKDEVNDKISYNQSRPNQLKNENHSDEEIEQLNFKNQIHPDKQNEMTLNKEGHTENITEDRKTDCKTCKICNFL